MSPCDFWFGKLLKYRLYEGNVRTLPELKASITRHVAQIDREALRAAVEHGITRFEHVLDANGMHREHTYAVNK